MGTNRLGTKSPWVRNVRIPYRFMYPEEYAMTENDESDSSSSTSDEEELGNDDEEEHEQRDVAQS